MFGGKEKDSTTTWTPPTPSAAPAPSKGGEKQITAYLGPDVHIEGTLRFDNSVLIEGTFKGEIHSGGNLVIGENAKVDAQISTRTITIKGEVKGKVEASERIELKNNGRLQGDIVTPSLQMDETVFFQGSCSMPSSGKNESSPRNKQNEKKEPVQEIVDAVETSTK